MSSQDRFPVYAKRLKDSPYTSGEDSWTSFTEDKVSNLANEVVNGNNTCYLVSGYRGVGKTSFILKVKERAEKMLDERKSKPLIPGGPPDQVLDCLFVLTNFAKYENHKSLLRRMIRDVYQEYKKNKVDEAATDDAKELERRQKRKEFDKKIEDLYVRTFQDVKTQISATNSQELKISASSKFSEIVKKYGSLLLTIVGGSGAFYFLKQWAFTSTPTIIIFAILSIIVFLTGVVDLSISYEKVFSKETKNTIEDIYDDEIADFKFQELLDEFKKIDFRLVFVLDELDKVSVADLDNLIKEMKPYLLSGKAHFVIVAGQELAYRYLWVYSGDDAVIGSLFSKFYHIPLFDVDSLQGLGLQLINFEGAPTDAITRLSPLMDYLIFKCRRVPRAFIARFRQSTVWESNDKGEELAYIRIPDQQATLLYSQVLNIINDIERVRVAPKQYEPVLNDYLVTQLFINAQQMMFKKDYQQTVEEYLDRYAKSDQLADKAYYQNVEEILRELFTRMVQETIVKEKPAPPGESNTMPTETGQLDIRGGEGELTAKRVNIVGATTPELVQFKKEWYDFIGSLGVFWEQEIKRLPSLAALGKENYAIMEHFNSVNAIYFSPVQSKQLIAMINGEIFPQDDDHLNTFRNELTSYSINPRAFQRQLTEYSVKQMLRIKLSVEYVEQSLTGYSTAFVNGRNIPDLLIYFKHSDSSIGEQTDLKKLVENLSSYNAVAKKGNIAAVIETFFNAEKEINEVQLVTQFDITIGHLNPYYLKKINYFPIPARLNSEVLDKIVSNCLAQLVPYKEFSINETLEDKKQLGLRAPGYNADDPQKSLWGGQSTSKGKTLSAYVVPVRRPENSFSITLKVEGDSDNPLQGFVYFLVNNSFREQIYRVLATKNAASLELTGSGAFTVGAVCDNGTTELELDLSKVKELPSQFREGKPTSPSNAGTGLGLSSASKNIRKK